jgi:hypothetical protein
MYAILVGNPEGKRPLGRSRRRWKYNIKIDLKAIGWEGGRVWSGFIRFRTAGKFRKFENILTSRRLKASQEEL